MDILTDTLHVSYNGTTYSICDGACGGDIPEYVMPAGAKSPFNHIHKQNEEIYIFLTGNGTFTVDDDKIEIKPGTAIRVATGAKRAMENTGATEMQYICVQAKENSLTQFAFADAEVC